MWTRRGALLAVVVGFASAVVDLLGKLGSVGGSVLTVLLVLAVAYDLQALGAPSAGYARQLERDERFEQMLREAQEG